MGTKGGLQAAVMVVVSLSGCAYGEMREVLRTNLAASQDCPAMTVKPRNPAHERDLHPQFNNQYIAEGCGIVRTYTCPDQTGLVEYDAAAACTFIEGNANDPTVEASTPDTAGGENAADAAADEDAAWIEAAESEPGE